MTSALGNHPERATCTTCEHGALRVFCKQREAAQIPALFRQILGDALFDFAGLRATAGEKEKGEGGGEKRGSKSQQEVVGDGTASRGEDAPWPHSTFSPSHPLVIHSATASDTNKITSHTTITSTSTVDNSSNRNDDGHLVIAGASVPLEMNAMGVANKKKKKKTKPPPDTYVCRLCGIKGHWLWQCSEKSGEERKR